MTCFICGKSLAGGLDTFGPPETPLCQACYWQALLLGEQEERRLRAANEWNAEVPSDWLHSGLDILWIDRLEA